MKLFKHLGKQKKYTRFIVLCRSRTGSNLLVNSLKKHPQIHIFGEIFRGGVGDDVKAAVKESAEQYLENTIFKHYDRSVRAVGFKIFYQHPVWDSSGNVWRYLQALERLKVIHLTRRNILRTMVSQRIAMKTDVWKEADLKHAGSGIDKRVTLSKEDCEEFFEKTRSWERDGDERFSGREILHLDYEDLCSDFESQMQRVLQFLDVAPADLRPQTRRQNPEALRDLIANYEQLRSEFSGSPWGGFFE